VFERYTEPARRTIFFARWWALNRKAAEIEPSDIILGAAQEVRRLSEQLRWMNLDRDRLIKMFAEGVVTIEKPNERQLPLSNESKFALAYAAEEAKLDGRYALEVYHLVRGVLRTECAAAKALSDAGYTIEVLREGSRIANQSLPDAQLSVRVRRQLRRLTWRVFSVRELLVLGFTLIAFVGAILYLRSQN